MISDEKGIWVDTTDGPFFAEFDNDSPLAIDLFSGLRGGGSGFVKLGYRVIGVELNEKVNTEARDIHHYIEDYVISIFDIDEAWCEELIARHGPVKVVWASPPCTGFSVASCGHHWNAPEADGTRTPKSDKGRLAVQLVEHTLKVIGWLNPDYFWIENPVGILRKLPLLNHLQHHKITYCRYGEERMKPTDLWGKFPGSWRPRPPCNQRSNRAGTMIHNDKEYVPDLQGEPCHVVARRGMSTGTQGIKGNALRSVVAHELSFEVAQSVINGELEVWL